MDFGGPRPLSFARGTRGDDSMRFAQFALAATLTLCTAANADAPPELYTSLPLNLSFFQYADFVAGRALRSDASVVPAAYMIVYSGIDTGYLLWTTDGTA